MSIPPQLIRVKRKRVEEAPVTFLQFDDAVKRHRSGSHWAYQRRDPRDLQPPSIASSRDVNPVIHVSQPADGSVSPTKPHGAQASPSPARRPIARAKSPSPAQRQAEPRRFHISRTLMAPTNQPAPAGISKKARSGPAIFVERTRKKMAHLAQQRLPTSLQQTGGDEDGLEKTLDQAAMPAEARPLKKPGATTRTGATNKSLPSAAPLPPSLMNRHNQDMDKIAADMNDWVLNEIGANLETIEHEKQQERQQAERAKFRPKAPARRYQERQHQPDALAPSGDEADKPMTDVSDDEGDEGDWIIDEYVRIPANSMALDVAPAEVGLLVLDGEEDSILFFGPEHDDDDELGQDDEDENAENYYTADYPEDEVDSEDEYGRQAYLYRNGNASDDEEFDHDVYDDGSSDDMVIEKGADDDATMERIRAYNSKHNNAAFR